MPFIQVQQLRVSHQKTLRLARLMGVDRYAAISRLMALWCLDHAPVRDGLDNEKKADECGARFRAVHEVIILILDDLGAEKRSEWSDQLPFKLLDYRYRRELPTAVASNLIPADLELRIASRLQDRALRGAADGRVGLLAEWRSASAWPPEGSAAYDASSGEAIAARPVLLSRWRCTGLRARGCPLSARRALRGPGDWTLRPQRAAGASVHARTISDANTVSPSYAQASRLRQPVARSFVDFAIGPIAFLAPAPLTRLLLGQGRRPARAPFGVDTLANGVA